MSSNGTIRDAVNAFCELQRDQDMYVEICENIFLKFKLHKFYFDFYAKFV